MTVPSFVIDAATRAAATHESTSVGCSYRAAISPSDSIAGGVSPSRARPVTTIAYALPSAVTTPSDASTDRDGYALLRTFASQPGTPTRSASSTSPDASTR
jgi:hypothetical protein